MICSDLAIHKETSCEFKNDLNSLRFVIKQKSVDRKIFKKFLNTVFKNEGATHNQEPTNQIGGTITVWLSIMFNLISQIARTSVSVILIFVVIYLLASNHNATRKFITRNSQNYIYPVMRSVRLWTLPVIRKYRGLTDWHEEDCLIKNPFYQESFLDCWPCEDVRTMVDLTGLSNYSQAYVYNEKPFLVRDVMKSKFTLSNLTTLFKEHSTELERGTAKFLSSHSSVRTLGDFIRNINLIASMENFHILWKVNRVAAARVLRQAFKRPYFVPNTSEVALQRYLCISESEAPQFHLPMTDFANVWVAQGQGYRLIVLDPSDLCKANCSTLSVLLRPKDVLYYNWQFWKPRSLPARLSEDTSITYIGSFY